MSERSRKMICANCKHDYIEGDKYCRYCGAPMENPEYNNVEFFQQQFQPSPPPPYRPPQPLYGPPPIPRVYKCEKCGFTWKTTQRGQNWCPKCGGYAPEGTPWYFEAGTAPVLEMHLNNVQDYLNNVREYVDVAFARMENEKNKEA